MDRQMVDEWTDGCGWIQRGVLLLSLSFSASQRGRQPDYVF